MRILLLMNPGIPVPPELYGGIERIVYLLAEEYHRTGHEVTLLAGPGSYCSGTTITFGTNSPTPAKIETCREIMFVWRFLSRNHRKFDRIHNFGRLIYFLPILNKKVLKIMSYQRQVSVRGVKIMTMLPNQNLVFTACSDYCVSTGSVAGKWKTVYNAIDFSQYQLKEGLKNDAPLIFLGRLDKIKGVHTAIKVAKATNNQLIIAGNVSHTPDNYAYFKTEIEPLIDGEQIKYAGPLNDVEKNNYLQQAKAMLFPIEWDEPFGIVMIEAMGCGTPVIAFKRGAVSEVVEEGMTGIIVNDEAGMVAAFHRLPAIDRAKCRQRASERFDIKKIARDYLEI